MALEEKQNFTYLLWNVEEILLQNDPQDFDFFQWPWVPIIHLSLFSMRPVPPNLMDIIILS